MGNNALSFNGTNSVVTIPHNNIYNTLTLTLECWINTTTTDGNSRGIINKYVVSSVNGYLINLINGKIQCFYYNSSSNHINFTGAKIVSDGNWHHIAFVVDSTGGKLYVDGVLDISVTWTGIATVCTCTTNINIGYYNGTSTPRFNGIIDEIRMWNIAKSQSDIQRNMNNTIREILPSNLIGYWRLDEGTGTTTVDLTLNNNTGTLTSCTWVNGNTSISTIIIKYLISDKNNILYNFINIPSSNLVPIMTSNTVPSGIASASSIYTGMDAYQAFDKITTTSSGWQSINTGSLPQWIAYEFFNQTIIIKYTLTMRWVGVYNPSTWQFQGTNDDGVTWTTLDTQTNISGWVAFSKKEFAISDTMSYKKYRLYITATTGTSAYVDISEIELFGQSIVELDKLNTTTLTDTLFIDKGITEPTEINNQILTLRGIYGKDNGMLGTGKYFEFNLDSIFKSVNSIS